MRTWWVRLLGYAARYWVAILGILALLLTGAGLGLLTPWPLKLIVDHVLTGVDLPAGLRWIEALPGAATRQGQLVWLAAATVLLFIAGRVVVILERYLRTGVGSRMVYALAGDLFEALQRQSLRFHHQRSRGDLVRRVTADAACARELVLDVMVPLVVSVATLVTMFLVMWRLSRPLALVALMVAIPLGLVVRLFASPMAERKLRKKDLQGRAMAVAEQTLTAIPLVQAFGREGREDERFRHINERMIEASLRATGIKLQFKVVCGLVTAVAAAAVMVLGGTQVLEGSLSVGALLVLLHYFAALYGPMESLAYLSDSVASASAGATRVFSVLDSEEETLPERRGAQALDPARRAPGLAVDFEAVTFGYDAAKPVLHSVTTRIQPGETVAVIGPTGAGKSTLLSLVPRFYDPDQGRIRVGGEDLREVSLRSLRSRVTLVLQQPFLLPLSMAENIAYGRPGATRREIRRAARQARADEFIERLPEGYETMVGERGETLSGGERQRLAIARAILRDTPILLLDEPTASLDAFTESALLEILEELMADRTCIVVAHRLSTVRYADRILVLDEGRILEEGTPAELERSGGLYDRAHRLQTTRGGTGGR